MLNDVVTNGLHMYDGITV